MREVERRLIRFARERDVSVFYFCGQYYVLGEVPMETLRELELKMLGDFGVDVSIRRTDSRVGKCVYSA